MCGCVGVWVISRVFSGYCFYDRTLFFSRWDFPLRQTVNSTFTYLTYYNESPRYTYIFFPSLHFTPLQVSNQPFAKLQFPILNQMTPYAPRTRTTFNPNPSPSFTYPQGSSSRQKAIQFRTLIAESAKQPTNHLRTHENIRRGYLFCSMYSRSIRVP